jgi:hypothetical protein
VVFDTENEYIWLVMRGGTILLCAVGAWVLCPAVNGASRDATASPYQGIVERNVFGLKPPPPPPDPAANKPPPPRIFLQGITTFGGVKRALLKAQLPPKPGDKPTGEQSFILAEGQRDGDIEVLEIRTDTGVSVVKVNDFGTITNLTFEKDGIKGAPGAAPTPGIPPQPRTVMAVPGAMGGASGVPPSFARPSRLPVPGSASANEGVNPMGQLGYGAGANPSLAQQQTAPSLGPEAGALMLEANRLRHQQDIEAGRYPPLPRAPLTDAIQQEIGGGASAPAPVVQQPMLPRPGMPLPLPAAQ